LGDSLEPSLDSVWPMASNTSGQLEPACEHLGRKAVSGGQGGGGADENKEGRGGNMSLKIFM